MFKYLSLVLGIGFSMTVIFSFTGDNLTSGNLFGFEVNIWTFRLFWTILAIGSFYDFIKRTKKEKTNN